MRSKFRAAIICYFAILCSCTTLRSSQVTPARRLKPIHVGVETQLKPYVEEYFKLAAEQNVHFHTEITVGLNKIVEPNVIGWTYYGLTFREIDLDRMYWRYSSELSRRMLIYHELTHGYCGRDHDYGTGTDYPAAQVAGLSGLMERFFPRFSPIKDTAGYFDDTCPVSIMHPVHVEDYCAKKHWKEYVKEMFNRCRPF
jgi:hypothetical protein